MPEVQDFECLKRVLKPTMDKHPQIKQVLVINVEGLDFQNFVRHELFGGGKVKVHLTAEKKDKSLPPEIEIASPQEALQRYPESDLLILVGRSENYFDFVQVVDSFEGKFIAVICCNITDYLLDMSWKQISTEYSAEFYERFEVYEKYWKRRDENEIYEKLKEYKDKKYLVHIAGGKKRIAQDQLERISRVVFENVWIKQVIAINSGCGKFETALSQILFPNAELYLTDLIASPPHVEKLAAKDAIRKYAHSDVLMSIYPHANATGYQDILKFFNGNFIIFYGHRYTCDPEGCFIQQLYDWGDVVYSLCTPCCGQFNIDLVIFQKKKKDK